MTYKKTIVDIGTGDGRYIFKKAKENENNLYIGIDPSESQLTIYKKKANRQKLHNCIFMVGAIENPPNELLNCADEIIINFPWGSLLGGIILGNTNVIENITKLAKTECVIEMTLGYSQHAEPNETMRLELPKLSEDILEKIVESFKPYGFRKKSVKNLTKLEIKTLESSWGKKLAFGQQRDIFNITLTRSC